MEITQNIDRLEMADAHFMRRAIELAERARGRTCPNPLVGCVIVKDNRVISEGYHRKCGAAHAEREALEKLEPQEARGSTMYVTLEPCCHVGRQPPCTDLIIQSGVRRVVVGAVDVNPKVHCAGIKQLQDAGVEVIVGVLRAECEAQNLFFNHYMRTGLAYVALKYAMTLDGKIATRTGDSKWVTEEKARDHVQILRKHYSGILVGIGTVLTDDPLLTCRIDPQASPARVICDNQLRVPLDSQLVRTVDLARTIVLCDDNVLADESKARKKLELETAGVEVLTQPGGVNMSDVPRRLAELSIDSVLIEGGARIHASALEAGIGNYAYVYVAPKLIGGVEAKGPIGGDGVERMRDAVLLDSVKVSQLGNDYLFEGGLRLGDDRG
ncbi:MAG: bifunctional diaminohydroxyphosphoribosylaminopyrimidine deaminase/5-amino-6-(5-phosphoribosylamino)uracil reductase RibD [Fastidiosipilaceae bacterium]|jgi:diaminohydroxyphosphoribosylaminopyrimidine deaminase/5-amino-6-(5-phosphoribosylamino)uracil reductase